MNTPRRLRIRWLHIAVADLEAVRAYIAEHRPAAAAAVARRIRDAADSLATFPECGRPGRVAGTRELVVPPCVIAYRVAEGDVVDILKVLHGAQRWPERLSR